ncbi:phage tail protein [Permianibacter sp. IMCC34836]|uniref:phage tail protein n=1 Tax=Permianibacter fluminis TaxID=2738515 RepID=UPI0015563786|nr:phage tail protein [Permianibacter fluminis]NQD38316.1 phage tail protein [Permianibacter fluminis]
MAIYYPPVGFHFKVEVAGIPPDGNDVRFSEISGLSVELATEEVAEGGENRFVQKYPNRAKYPELVLKRGLLLKSEIWNWVRDNIEKDVLSPRNIVVKLLNENHDPLLTWTVVNAFPTKWAVSDLNASSNAVVVESLQFYYQYFTQDRA